MLSILPHAKNSLSAISTRVHGPNVSTGHACQMDAPMEHVLFNDPPIMELIIVLQTLSRPKPCGKRTSDHRFCLVNEIQ